VALPDEITANTWAENHKCSEQSTSDRRPRP
jgi:hypothetical protein